MHSHYAALRSFSFKLMLVPHGSLSQHGRIERCSSKKVIFCFGNISFALFQLVCSVNFTIPFLFHISTRINCFFLSRMLLLLDSHILRPIAVLDLLIDKAPNTHQFCTALFIKCSVYESPQLGLTNLFRHMMIVSVTSIYRWASSWKWGYIYVTKALVLFWNYSPSQYIRGMTVLLVR